MEATEIQSAMDTMMLSQGFIVVVLITAIIGLWRVFLKKYDSSDSKNEQTQTILIELVRNNTQTSIELKSVIERTNETINEAFKIMREDVKDHNVIVSAKLDRILEKLK